MLLTFHRVYVLFLLTILCLSSAQTVAAQRADERASDAEERGYLEALDAAIKAPGDQRQALYSNYLSLAGVNEDRHRFSEAEKYYELAYETGKTLFGVQSREVATTLNHLGAVRLEQGRFGEADKSFREALHMLESDKDADSIDIAAVLNNLAVVQQSTGNVSRSADLMRKAVKVFETHPAARQETLGIALSNLATMLRQAGDRAEAMTTATRAVSILERGENSEDFATSLVTLGRLHLDEGDSTRAEALIERALGSIDKLGKEESPMRALILAHLGVVYGRNGRTIEAEPCFQRSIEMNKRLLGPEHPKLLDAMGAYADFLRTKKRKGEAKKLEAYIREHREKYLQQNPSVANTVDVHSLLRQSGH